MSDTESYSTFYPIPNGSFEVMSVLRLGRVSAFAFLFNVC